MSPLSHLAEEAVELIKSRHQLLTYEALSEHLNIPANEAKRTMLEVYRRGQYELDAIFCLIGSTTSSSITIQLVKDDWLERIISIHKKRLKLVDIETLKQYTKIRSIYVYCLGRKGMVENWNVANMQPKELEEFFQLLTVGSTSQDDGSASIHGAYVVEARRGAVMNGASKKIASKPVDEEELAMSPTKRRANLEMKQQLKEEGNAKRKMHDEINEAKKRPKVTDSTENETDEWRQMLCYAEKETRNSRTSIKGFSREHKQASLTSFFKKK